MEKNILNQELLPAHDSSPAVEGKEKIPVANRFLAKFFEGE